MPDKKSKPIRTIGELRTAIKCCENEEPISFLLTKKSGIKKYLSCYGFSSTAGGRAVIMHLDPLPKNED